MVGFCGIVGDADRGLDRVTDAVVWSEDEHGVRHRAPGVDLFVSLHRSEEADAQPATTGDRSLWVWGDVLGFEGENGYEPRPHEGSDAEYCAGLVADHGVRFVDGLNSEFAGVVLEEGETTLFTDRLGARPIYYTECIDGALLFGTHPKAILAHPEVETTVDEDAVAEFLALERVFGTRTPFDELSRLHPGARLRYDPSEDAVSRTVYWRPEYDPVDRGFGEFVREFSTRFGRAVEERRTRGGRDGVLISGGSDSRLVLSALDGEATGYHMNETMNREAETARRVCEHVGAPFRFLERGPDYQSELLDAVAGRQLFASFFDQAHAAGFDGTFRSEVDGLFCGHYGDTILGGRYLPKRLLPVPGLGWTVPLPVARSVGSEAEYVDALLADHAFTRNPTLGAPDYLRSRGGSRDDIASILLEGVAADERGVVHHGVSYPSLDDLVHAGGYYPLSNTNGYLFYYSLVQMVPTHYPFLDNRIVDLALSMPRRYHTGKSLVNRTLSHTAPELAAMAHAGTRLPPSYPALAHLASDHLGALAGKLGSRVGSSGGSGGGAWPDHDAALRESDLVPRSLEALDGGAPWAGIDPEAARATYEAHLGGESRYFELYGLLSLLSTYPFDGSGLE